MHCFHEMPQCVVPPFQKRLREMCMYAAPAAPLLRDDTTSPDEKISLSCTKSDLPASVTATPTSCSQPEVRPREPWPLAGSRQKYELKRMVERRRKAPAVPGVKRTIELAKAVTYSVTPSRPHAPGRVLLTYAAGAEVALSSAK